MLGEAVGYVADVFEQAERVGVAGKPQRFAPARQEDLLLPLGQRDHARGLNAQALQRVEGRGELTLAAVDQ